MENEIEDHAPGFKELIRGRHMLAPPDLESRDGNLVSGAINGGTAQLHQQLVAGHEHQPADRDPVRHDRRRER